MATVHNQFQIQAKIAKRRELWLVEIRVPLGFFGTAGFSPRRDGRYHEILKNSHPPLSTVKVFLLSHASEVTIFTLSASLMLLSSSGVGIQANTLGKPGGKIMRFCYNAP